MADSEDGDDERIDSAAAVGRLVLLGLGIGIVATGVAGAVHGSQGLNPLSWMTSVATVAALVTALGVYRVQHRDADDAHQELMDRLGAQDELLSEFASAVKPEDVKPKDDAEPTTERGAQGLEALTAEQRAEVESLHGPDSIAEAWQLGRGRGDRPRLVRLKDGQLVTVYSRGGRTYVHAVDPRRGSRRPRRSS